MRLWSLLLIGTSALTLSACATLGLGDGEAKTAAVAPKATAAAQPSAQEEKELINLMGDDAGKPVTPEAAVEPVSVDAAAPDETALAAAEEAAIAAKPAEADFTPGVPDGCPGVEVLPDTKSITYFDDKDGRPIGEITARAALVDVRGGCDYTDNSVVVDIDMIMQGHIGDKGRYEGRRDLEAFMTFPYFVAVMDPDGKMIDKKIMATAMRFKPEIDDLDHAEKITQTIPLKDIGMGSKYTITLGFQLNRQQLDYNRGTVSDKKPLKTQSTPVKTPEADAPAPAPKAEVKPDPKPAAKTEADLPVTKTTVVTKPAETGTTTTSPAGPAPAKSGSSRMSPILE